MPAILVPQARAALSPEWEHGFNDQFTEIVTGDPDLVKAEFDALIGACWEEPPQEPGPAASRSESPPAQPPTVNPAPSRNGDASGDPAGNRPPP
jgi:hypothetical protein